MKYIHNEELPEVSGGIVPEDDCFPPLPYPTEPYGPFPEPLPSPIDPAPFLPAV